MTTANLKMINLLLVSDNQQNQQIIKDIFDAHIEILHIATSTRQGLDLFKREHPEVVIIDSTLKGVTQGLYVELRQLCGADGVIIALTQTDNSSDVSLALSGSVDDCITITTPPELMRRRLKNMLLMNLKLMERKF
ncbi:MAG: response regulator [Anaerolineae bacterium]|nr:response regulator [Anaerolineae bacterium]